MGNGWLKRFLDREEERMVDIAMCNRSDCGKKGTCFRYLAFPDELQSYIMIDQLDTSDGCDMYWKCRNADELREMNYLNQ